MMIIEIEIEIEIGLLTLPCTCYINNEQYNLIRVPRKLLNQFERYEMQ